MRVRYFTLEAIKTHKLCQNIVFGDKIIKLLYNTYNMTLGEKIREYREEKGMSQFDLELEIETSNGRISKIENGVINPDKETIVAIAKALELETPQIASLFGIEMPDLNTLINHLTDIILLKKSDQVVDRVVNDLIFRMGYIASALFLVQDDKIYMHGLTYTNISAKALAFLPKPLDELYIPLKIKKTLQPELS